MTTPALRPISVPVTRVNAVLLAPAGTAPGVYGYGPLTLLLLARLHVPAWLPAPERRQRYAGAFASIEGVDVDPAFDALVRELHGEEVRWAASVTVYLDDPVYTGRVALAFRGKRLVAIVAPRVLGMAPATHHPPEPRP